MDGTNMLDADELLHLAVCAIEGGDHETAIVRLKRCLASEPARAQAHYLLGAEYAAIGMSARAVERIGRAVELEPAMHVARFQLGMLLVVAGRVDDAELAWAPLDALGEAHPLFLFKTGVIHMLGDRFVEARQCLRAGIERNTVVDVLNRDMASLLARIDAMDAQVASADQAPAPENTAQHIGVSAYHGREGH